MMKHVAHLEQLASALTTVYDEAHLANEPFHLLVMDDEADDSSVVDTAAESTYDDLTMQRKQVPRRILDLWESRRDPGETKTDNVYSTYLAYTATPQANFLQDPANPLAPSDFVASLRTPGPEGDFEIRSSSYRTTDGPRGWYTGGEMFYRTLAEVPLCVETDDQAEHDVLQDSVRAYLVASAVRLARSPGAVGPRSAEIAEFSSRDAAGLEPMSMLIHPSSAKEEHFDVARRVVTWSMGGDLDPSLGHPGDGLGRRLNVDALRRELDDVPEKWHRWLADYRRSARLCHELLEVDHAPVDPSEMDWDTVRRLLVEEVIPGTRVAVINSDENADDRPHFSPWHDGAIWRAPKNLSTIFVSGNVMSRGLTLEGLTTTLFTRASDTPLADTQMQMQRWFGYRGKIIDLCRVFMQRDQIEQFTIYHENDEALRRDVLAAMSSTGLPPDIRVLQGRSFQATGKISNVRGIPLWPGPKPFVRHLTPAATDDVNLRLITRVLSDDPLPVPDAGARQGLLAPEPVGLLEAADLLDGLRYDAHGPGPASREASRWTSVANHAGLSSHDQSWPLYRAPFVEGSIDLGHASPYVIAAYLRLWAVCLDRRVRGMVTTDEPSVLWDLVDLDVRQKQQPKFWIGLRFGDGPQIHTGPLASLPAEIHGMARAVSGGTLNATWGSRGVGSSGIVGDEYFESKVTGQVAAVSSSGARLPGNDGLILFHLVDRGEGAVSIGVGLSIPLGGPDHVQAHSRVTDE
ncbi:hypothetical protein ASD16_09860 [Cellulomonas sp. Root485]|nr:hypothetical protein ASD16_09860 [Cellulomonas sp. Root485]